MTRTIVLLVALSFGISLGEHNDSETNDSVKRIVNGVRSLEGEYPYSVDVLKIHSKVVFPICGGTIVHNSLVLTAAHCISCGRNKKADVSKLYVVAGSINLNLGTLHKVIKGECHPDWSENTAKNDLALLKTANPFNGLYPVPLAYHDDVTKDISKTCVAVGWGERQMQPMGRNLAPKSAAQKGYVLDGLYVSCEDKCFEYKVELPTIPIETCIKKIENVTKDYKVFSDGSQLCAYQEGKDACQGDSGGPLICDGYQYGIISWGIGCAVSGVPGIYTRINYFAKWINDTMLELTQGRSLGYFKKNDTKNETES